MKKLFYYIVGNASDFDLIHRISNAVLILSVLFGVQATVGNIILGLPMLTIYGSIIMGFVLYFLYYLSRFKGKREFAITWALVIALAFYIPIMWIGNAGSSGGMVYYLFMYGAFISSLLQSKKALYFVIAFIVESLLFYILEYKGIMVVYNYPTELDRLLDLLISFVFVMVGITVTIYLYKSQYQKSHQQIQEKNESLNQLIEEVSSQRDEIEAQIDKIEVQRNKIEEIHNEISQSIDYAQRLQKSVFPKEEALKPYVSDYFALLKPKDKVSGDFYWWSHVENYTVITATDCTGHGVPGAYMSMLGISFLREIVNKEYITHPGVILRKLRKEIVKVLNQKGELGEQKDGMDMALVSIQKDTYMVQYSGANNPLYIVTQREIDFQNNERAKQFIPTKDIPDCTSYLYEIRPDKMPIAYYDKMDKFLNHEIQLQKGDQIYLFSDGFADQFGGDKGKKFKYKAFKCLLLENAKKSMAEQKQIIEQTFETWKGSFEQIDDVVILGVKL
ncbi:MAG: SpoIIE family protein phosphatase [Bacteroidales bacterium]|nr:SpoIIE family protein phosphatase [Bacteroidales bacterium]